MRASTAFSLLALAGSALAMPEEYDMTVTNNVVEVKTVYQTVYATYGAAPVETTLAYKPRPTKEAPKPEQPKPITEAYTPAPKPTTVVEQPKPTTVVEQPKPTTEAYQAPTSTEVYEAPAPSATQAPPPSEDGYMGVVNEWRAKMGMEPLKHNNVLEMNAAEVVKRGNGEMKHKLFEWTNGQVLAPGEAGQKGFEHVFVGGWLCEISSLPGLNGICDTMSKGWAYMGQTGHAEILKDPKHKTIGCALDKGIWCCDLSMDEPKDGEQEDYSKDQ